MLPRAHGSALFTRGETQALVVTTLGTGQDEQIIDALDGEYPRALHAALQLPALFGRRGRPHGLARPARDRPRQARLARHPAAAADQGRLPLHDPRRLGDHRVERLVLDGDRLRHLAVDDGRGRAAQGAGRGHRHGPDQGRRRRSPSSPTSSATRIIWATWTSRWPAPTNGVTSLQMDIKITCITEEIMQIALAQARDGRLHILGEMAEALDHAARGRQPARAAHHHDQHPQGQDPRSDRHRRQGDPRDHRSHRRQDRHRGRRHDQGRGGRRRSRAGGDRLDPRHRRRAGGRRDLHRQGGQGGRFRRLRELPRRARRPRPHLRAGGASASARSATSSRKATWSRSRCWASTIAAR